ADKIRSQFGGETAIARLGGDEFAIIVNDDRSRDTIVKSIKSLIMDVAEPIDFEDHRVAVDCSVGVTFAEAGSLSADDLFSQADIALYEAKNLGKATYCIFTVELGGKKLKSKAMEMRLRHAIENDHLQLYYQPIVDAKTGDVVSMEALVRWFDPAQGMIPPNDFIPLAEETGLIVQIGETVLQKACEAAMLWPEQVRVSVNISPIQFRDLNLAQKIAGILAQTGLPPTRLELEITEATLLSDDSDSLKTLNALRETGVRIVMDDFGTGYSSLNYIRSFPFDKIKIDKSYVDELSKVSNKSNVILHSVLSMARHLELRTTAEGVETQDQMRQLRDAGCSELQGYYFNKPMAEKDVLAMFNASASDEGEEKRRAAG
ncbi:MAG: GGDEF and EAL domain-containing protein, partial [Hyphomicrobiales bacterium]|nr:GGDEF and EAL domain-containing protein [Hyphomicrobiales bacterium]